MNDVLYFVLAAVLLAFVWFLPKIRRRARGWGNEVGTRASEAYADGKLPGALAALGETLVLETDESTAARVVETAVATKPKRYRALGGGAYTAKFVEHGDVEVRLVPAGSGAQLQLESFRDYMKFPQGRREWDDLRERVTAAAAAENVLVRAGELLTFERREQVEESNYRWRRVSA
ncbi:hypothetical protein [Aeromicrobium sp. Leaf350]|uniref:hypothetical protein n=1 Tax=Aeromicrobium sp. Leaf350 TaxID=2876565 RepID=UPI001E54EBD0|nr:hypothetical protein [Aeromicrobium sp. Leaf350]